MTRKQRIVAAALASAKEIGQHSASAHLALESFRRTGDVHDLHDAETHLRRAEKAAAKRCREVQHLRIHCAARPQGEMV